MFIKMFYMTTLFTIRVVDPKYLMFKSRSRVLPHFGFGTRSGSDRYENPLLLSGYIGNFEEKTCYK